MAKHELSIQEVLVKHGDNAKQVLSPLSTIETLGENWYLLLSDGGARLRDMDHVRRAQVLTAETANELGSTLLDENKLNVISQIYWGGEYKRLFGGYSVYDLVIPILNDGVEQSRLLLPERMIHETKHGQMAEVMAADFRKVIYDLGFGGNNPRIVELNTGLGSLLYALLNKGFMVLATVERNTFIASYRDRVWKGLKLRSNGAKIINADAWDFVENDLKGENFEGLQLHAMIADPSWDPTKFTSNGDNFDFRSLTKPSGDKIVHHMLEHSPVAAMVLPGKVDVRSIREYATSYQPRLGFRHFIYNMNIGSRQVSEALTVFIRSDVLSHIETQVTEQYVSF